MGLSRLKSAASAFVATLLCISAIFSRSSNAETPDPQPNRTPSRQTILDCAKRYTGFDESYNVEKIETVPLSELTEIFGDNREWTRIDANGNRLPWSD